MSSIPRNFGGVHSFTGYRPRAKMEASASATPKTLRPTGSAGLRYSRRLHLYKKGRRKCSSVTKLGGQIKVPKWAKRSCQKHLTVWLFVTILFYLGASYFAIAGSDPIGGKLFAFLIPTFFLVVGLAMIHLSTWASRNDVEYVSTKIGEAFRANGA